jgi:capsular exopolysaccharide synthesis family protein
MSHIFDALQRSEAKRTRSDAPLSLAATELLEGAERAAISQWKVDSETEPTPGSERDHANVLFGPDGLGRLPAGEDAAALIHALEAEERRECFGQFQTLTSTLPENSHLASLAEVASPAAEAFRLLGVRLRHLRAQKELKKILVTSTVPQEGKSVVAANIACTLACRKQQKVLLLDGDVRRPSQARLLGLPSVAGLCNCLQGERSLIASIYRLEDAGLWILPAGNNRSSLVDPIQSPQLPALLQKLSTWFDWIVIDSPPVLPLADTSVWARLADGILLVTRRGTTEKRKLQKGLEALDQNKLIGALMNSSNGAANGDYYYYRPTSGTDDETRG